MKYSDLKVGDVLENKSSGDGYRCKLLSITPKLGYIRFEWLLPSGAKVSGEEPIQTLEATIEERGWGIVYTVEGFEV